MYKLLYPFGYKFYTLYLVYIVSGIINRFFYTLRTFHLGNFENTRIATLKIHSKIRHFKNKCKKN